MRSMSFEIAEALQLNLNIQTIEYGLEPESLFGLSIRRNPNRPFLFTSKVIGKHIAIEPQKLLAAGALLSGVFHAELESVFADILNGKRLPPFQEVLKIIEEHQKKLDLAGKTLFIGFAETATALAQSVFQCFSGETAFINTTRAELEQPQCIDFLEEHSHAKQHYLYLSAEDPFLKDCQTIAFIDDELTTGNTILNIIKAMHRVFQVKQYKVFTVLDWRGKERQQQFSFLEKELGINIQVQCLLKGEISYTSFQEPKQEDNLIELKPVLEQPDYSVMDLSKMLNINFENSLSCHARKLFHCENQQLLWDYCQRAAQQIRPQGSTLCIGTGEFIYTPLIMGGFLDGEVYFQSTTQSPIRPWGKTGSAIVTGVQFPAIDTYSPRNFIYNIEKGRWNSAFVFLEKEFINEIGLNTFMKYLRSLEIENLTAVYL